MNKYKYKFIMVMTWLTISVIPSRAGDGQGEANSAISLLKEARLANESRYPAGKMRVTLNKGQSDPNTKQNNIHELIIANLEWSGELVRTELTRWGPSPDPLAEGEGKPEREICILDNKKFMLYTYKSKIWIDPIAGKDVFIEYNLTPKERWYTSQVQAATPGIKLFDKGMIEYKNPKDIDIILSHKSNEISLLRRDADTGSLFSADFSPGLDGNLTRFELDSVGTGLKIFGAAAWKRDPEGRVYLWKFDRKQVDSSRGRPIELYDRIEISDFDPDHRPNPARFGMGSMNIPPGTVVVDSYSGKNYRVGDRPASSVYESLDVLATSMRGRGFANATGR